MSQITVWGNIVIAAFYVLLACFFWWVCGKLERGPRRYLMMGGYTLFFLGCGLHHVGFSIHVLYGTAPDAASWHHFVPMLMQVVGAPVALIASIPTGERIAELLDS